jgi:hypothetical protein
MAQYLMLIYEDESEWAGVDEQQGGEMMAEYREFGERNASAIVDGNALQGTDTATTVRRDGDDQTTTDGPFAETKEALGGYYLVEAPDLDEAIAIAKQIPARFGGVEVRPVRVFD